MTKLHFVDTTIRDGNLSLWASNMRTDMILPTLQYVDQIGYLAHETISSAFFKKMVRELNEDPWERLRIIAKHTPKTPSRAIVGRSVSAFEFTPDSVTCLYMERLAANGVSEVRISDPSNTVEIWKQKIDACNRVGLKVVLNLIYTVSPKHTDAYYEALAVEAAKLNVFRICIKDPGGLLTPERTRTLVPKIMAKTGKIPLEFHTHCNSGLGPLCAVEAFKAGVDIINTATPPLANASSNPSVFNVYENGVSLGFEPTIDLEPAKKISAHFAAVAKRESLPVGVPLEYKESHFQHQVPGGMISNLRHQLGLLKMEHRLPEVLEETARVRHDLGYPIMVTPYSQFVGAQAAMNVIVGERYKQISDQIIQYALGFWGKTEREAILPDVLDRIVSSPRAKELKDWKAPDPTEKEIRAAFGGAGVSDDDIMLRYVAGAENVAAMKQAPPRSDISIDGMASFVTTVRDMMRSSNTSYFSLKKSDLDFSVVRNAGTK